MIFWLEVDGTLRKCKVHGRQVDELRFLNYCRSSTKQGTDTYYQLTDRIKAVAKEIVDSGKFEVRHGDH